MKIAAILVTAAIGAVATAAVAQIAERPHWGSGDPCQRFAGTRGLCTREGRWKTVSGDIATFYLPNGRSFAMHIVDAEVNSALDSDPNAPSEDDVRLNEELRRARIPY